MKARVKETGEIIEVHDCSADMYVEKFGEITGRLYHITELDFDNLEYPDYWTRLEHTYAGMAMQQLVHLVNVGYEYVYEETAIIAMNFAHALVEKMKNQSV